MSEPVEGTLTAGEVTVVEITGPVSGVEVTATGADIWVSTDGGTPFVNNPNTAERVPDGETRTVDVPDPTNPTIVKLRSRGTPGYTVTGLAGGSAGASVEDIDAAVEAAIAALVASAPATLDTLNELAAALGDDADFATTVTAALADKSATDHTHSGATDAADVTVTPAGTIAATDVQAALVELDTEKATAAALTAHDTDTTSVHGIADTADVVIGDGIDAIVALTQAAYDLLTPDATTLYVIVEA